MAAKKLSDIEILTKCLEAIDERSEDANIQWVLDSIARKLVITLDPVIDKSTNGAPAFVTNLDGVPVGQLIRAKKPSDAAQTIVVLAHYLKQKDPAMDISTKTLNEAKDEAGITSLKNMVRDLDYTIRRAGFITSGKNKRLSILGEDVYNALPDSDKVKELIKSQKAPSKKKPKNKK